MPIETNIWLQTCIIVLVCLRASARVNIPSEAPAPPNFDYGPAEAEEEKSDFQAAVEEEAFAFEVKGGSLDGHDHSSLCLNEAGKVSDGSKPWNELKFSERQLRYLRAQLEVFMSKILASGMLGSIFRKDEHAWVDCAFKASQYEEFTIETKKKVHLFHEPRPTLMQGLELPRSVDDALPLPLKFVKKLRAFDYSGIFQVSEIRVRYAEDGRSLAMEKKVVPDNTRMGWELIALVILLVAPGIANSFVVWCMAGGFGGGFILSLLIVMMVMRKAKHNTAVGVGFGLFVPALGSVLHIFWDTMQEPIMWAYGTAMFGGVVYCYRNEPAKKSKDVLQYVLQGLALYLAYTAVRDSGAGPVAVVLHLFVMFLWANFSTIARDVLYAVLLPVARTFGAEEALIRNGMLVRQRLFARNNYIDGVDGADGYATPRDRMDAFHRDGVRHANREVAKLLESPEYKAHLRRKEEDRRSRCRGRVLQFIGTFLLPCGLAAVALHYMGLVNLAGLSDMRTLGKLRAMLSRHLGV